MSHPQITIFDHRGCARKGKEYKGELSGGQDDEMLVKVAQTQLKIDSPAFKELASSVLQVSRHTFLTHKVCGLYGVNVRVLLPAHLSRWLRERTGGRSICCIMVCPLYSHTVDTPL